jgi:integrase/recombinase XerD
MTYSHISLFAERIENFIEQKRSLGFDYTSGGEIMKSFDRFCHKYYPDEMQLSRMLCFSWAVRRGKEGNRTFLNRISPVREFAKFLISIGEEAFILPECFPSKGQRPTPHILSEGDINKLWATSDNITPIHNNPIKRMVIPTIVRLIYCCGLRPCEARRLRPEDVETKHRRFKVLESKGHKDRIVYMAADVAEMLRTYDNKISALLPERKWFFPRESGEMCQQDWLRRNFKNLCDLAGICPTGGSVNLYCLRHSFATHRIYKWLAEGKNVNAMIPYLSTYMGHSQISDTCYYIHLIPELLTEMSGQKYGNSADLLPEVEVDE